MGTSRLSTAIRDICTTALPGGASLTDGQLLDRFIERRDEASFAALVRRHGPVVWGVCRRVAGHHHDAEDAFQAAFLVLAKKAASVRPREMVANWLYGVAYRTALKVRAASLRRRSRERQVENLPDREPAGQGPASELGPLLDQEIARLPDKYRIAILLCDLEGKTRKEAARQLAIPEGTVSSRLTTARSLLAKRLGRRGVTLCGGLLASALPRHATAACVPASAVSSTVAGAFSTAAVAFTRGVLMSRFKAVMALLVVVTLAAGGGLLTVPTSAGQPEEAEVTGARKEAPQSPPEALIDCLAPAPPPRKRPAVAEEVKTPPAWANKLFDATSKDFGECKRGERATHRFKMTNIYNVPLEITAVRASAGCVAHSLSPTRLQPRESGYLEVTLDTRRFTGGKTVYVYVTVGREYVSTARLTLTATSVDK